jgi:hypothetical protein
VDYADSLPGCPEPSLFRDVKNNAVRIFELALKVLLLLIISKVEEERAASVFDALLDRPNIFHLKTKMMGADEILCIIQPRAALAEIIQERQVYDAIAEIDRRREVEGLLTPTRLSSKTVS